MASSIQKTQDITPALTVHSTPADNKAEPLKLVIVGHVDHGKSTLIGRILYDTESVEPGRVEKARRICEEQHKPFELAFLLDALEEEQLQGITIDTTQIRFSTEKQDFVIIDAPGHKEFLKNMISGAANASAAVLMIDAHEGVQEQSRRHGYLLSLLGIKNIIVVINKLDLVNYDEQVFNTVRAEFLEFLGGLGVEPLEVIPVSARQGDNVVHRSEQTPWYTGPTFLEALERLEHARRDENLPLRLTVQDVYKFDERRIVAGRIDSGRLKIGDTIQVLPSGHKAKVTGIETWPENGKKAGEAEAGYNVGITLDYQLFVDRGHVITHIDNGPQPSRYLSANVFWMSKNPLVPGRRYKLKIGPQEVYAYVHRINRVLNASTLELDASATGVPQNDVGEIVFRTEQPVVADAYGDFIHTARLVIIDRYDVAGGGIILETGQEGVSTNGQPVGRRDRELANGHSAAIVRVKSGNDKLLPQLERQLFDAGIRTYLLRDEPADEVMRLLPRLVELGLVILLPESGPEADTDIPVIPVDLDETGLDETLTRLRQTLLYDAGRVLPEYQI